MLVVVGSWIWVALMSINLHVWKRDNPGEPVPLAMFANVAGSYLWAWTAVGAALELLFQIIPVALGLDDTIDAGLARVFFSWTLHAIVYFWLMPTYIAYYTIVPRAIGGRLYSDTMGRIAFILFLVVAMPIGMHHTVRGPAGRRRLQVHPLGLHRAGRAADAADRVHDLRIGRDRRRGCAAAAARSAGSRALPWHNPIMLAVAFSFVMLGFGGAGGLINMSYQLDATDPQHAVDHRPFPPDLRRRDRHHVFRDRLRHVAASDRPRARRPAADARAALDLVHRHDRADLPLALGRHSRHAAPHGVSTTTPIRRSRRRRSR